MEVHSWYRPVWFAVLVVAVLTLVWFWARPTASWRMEAAISERCLPPLDLADSIRTCLDGYTAEAPADPWARDYENEREHGLFACMREVGLRASSRPWGVPMGACVVSTARRLNPDDPYALLPPCSEEDCGMTAQVREGKKWAARFCRARYPEGAPPGCG
jgi:hypothetical protein